MIGVMPERTRHAFIIAFARRLSRTGEAKAQGRPSLGFRTIYAALQIFLICRDGQFIDAFVFWMSTMAGDPGVGDRVSADEFIELPPKFLVLDGRPTTFLLTPPTVGLPFGKPLGHSLADIDAVGEQLNGGTALQRFEAANHGGQFHPIVRGVRFAARGFELFARLRMPQ